MDVVHDMYMRGVARVVNAVGRGANVRGVGRGAGAGTRRRRGASEAAIDEARTRLAHTADTLIVDSNSDPPSQNVPT